MYKSEQAVCFGVEQWFGNELHIDRRFTHLKFCLDCNVQLITFMNIKIPATWLVAPVILVRVYNTPMTFTAMERRVITMELAKTVFALLLVVKSLHLMLHECRL